jgi:glutaredoxin
MKKVLFFSMEKCPYCVKYKPTVKDFIQSNENVQCEQININSDIQSRHLIYNVTNFPTTLVLDGNIEKKRHAGLMDIETLTKFVLER